MTLKEYKWRGGTYQFDEDSVPEGAVLVEPKSLPVKAKAPRNKSARPANK